MQPRKVLHSILASSWLAWQCWSSAIEYAGLRVSLFLLHSAAPCYQPPILSTLQSKRGCWELTMAGGARRLAAVALVALLIAVVSAADGESGLGKLLICGDGRSTGRGRRQRFCLGGPLIGIDR